MGTLNEDLTGIKAVEDKLTANKVVNFAYTDHAYNNPLTEADGVTVYDVNHEQNIPVSDPTVLNVNETVLSKGWRSQASAITRMLMNHFLGRVSYNLNKLNDNFSATLATIMSHLGQPNGIATLDANGRIPYAQLPESAIEYEGNWNASTNTPTLVNGTGTKGDFYICNVAGTVDFGDGEISFLVNDRVIYDGAVWSKLSAGDVRTVNNIAPDSATGNVQLAKGDIGLGSVANTGDSANASSGGVTKFTTGGAYNLLISLASLFNTSTAYAVGDIITYQNRLYECTTAHSAGAWDSSHFTARSVEYLLRTYILPSLAPVFSTSTAYTVGQFVIYQNKLYRCTTAHSAGAWNSSHFTLANLNDVVNAGNATGTLSITHGGTGRTTTADGAYYTTGTGKAQVEIGTLPVAQGGTGKTTADGALNSFINALSTGASVPQDDDYFISQFVGGGTTTTTYHRRPISTLWTYIKNKITGAVSDVLTSNLTASRMVVTDANGKLTVASRIGVTGVKGDSETNYRTGDVNITKANIGLGNVGDTGDSPVPASGGTKKFTTGGAYLYFANSRDLTAWLGKAFGWALGKNWKHSTSANSSKSFLTVYYANGIWVAGCANNEGLWYSTNGKTWAKGTGSMTGYSFDTVYYANSIWVAGSVSNGLWWSTDGKAWTQGTGSMTSYGFNKVYYANGIWVAGSTSHGLWWSTDGKAWTQGTGATSYTIYTVYHANGIWVAGSSSQGFWWSTDGKAWTQVTGTTISTITEIYFANGIWVAVGKFGYGLWWSTDGKAWTQAENGEDGTGDVAFTTVYCADGIWVAGSTSHGLWWSGYDNASGIQF